MISHAVNGRGHRFAFTYPRLTSAPPAVRYQYANEPNRVTERKYLETHYIVTRLPPLDKRQFVSKMVSKFSIRLHLQQNFTPCPQTFSWLLHYKLPKPPLSNTSTPDGQSLMILPLSTLDLSRTAKMTINILTNDGYNDKSHTSQNRLFYIQLHK